MSTKTEERNPFTLEVVPPGEGGKHYRWAIRRNGKMLQRSDRGLPSEAKAREDGSAVIQRLLSNQDAW